MFQLLPCSICQRTFSLRKDVPEDSLLKCPNCGNQFRLGDVLDAFYSPWIVLDDAPSRDDVKEKPIGAPTDSVLSFDSLLETHAEPSATTNRDNAVTDDPVEMAADNVFDTDLEFTNKKVSDETGGLGDELQLDTLDTLDTQDAFDDGLQLEASDLAEPSDQSKSERSEFSTQGSSITAPPAAVKKPRARKGDKGGLWFVIQVVLGGAAAIPVTLLLLWYVAGQDIAGAGPAVAQFAPWIVPKKFQYPAENLPARTGPRVPPPPLGAGGFRNFDEELGKKPAESLDGTAIGASLHDPLVELGKKPAESLDGNATEVAISTDSNDPAAAAAIEDSGMRTTFETVRSVKQKIKDWDASSPDKVATIKTLFDELATIADQLSAAPREGGAIRLLKDDLKNMGRFVATPEVRRDFAVLQATQFKSPLPPNAARVYLGFAKKVDKAQGIWVITDGVNQDKLNTIVIEVAQQDIETLPVNQKFFCMGTLVDEPPVPEGAPKVSRISATYFQPLDP